MVGCEVLVKEDKGEKENGKYSRSCHIWLCRKVFSLFCNSTCRYNSFRVHNLHCCGGDQGSQEKVAKEKEYEIRETEGIYELSTGVDAQELPKMTVNNEVVIEPSVIFDNFDVQRLNSD